MTKQGFYKDGLQALKLLLLKYQKNEEMVELCGLLTEVLVQSNEEFKTKDYREVSQVIKLIYSFHIKELKAELLSTHIKIANLYFDEKYLYLDRDKVETNAAKILQRIMNNYNNLQKGKR